MQVAKLRSRLRVVRGSARLGSLQLQLNLVTARYSTVGVSPR